MEAATPLRAQPQVMPTPTNPYASLTYDESYAALRDPARRTDALDGLKFIALHPGNTAYLTLGGEARLRYQHFRNQLWGATPYPTNNSLEQRYLLSADLHLGPRVRAFSQLQSSWQNFRRGGPGPNEENRLALHQAFVDVVLPLPDSSSLTLRPGRQEFYYGTGKLIDPLDAGNTRLSFDALRLLLRYHHWRTDLLLARPIINNPGWADDRPDDNQLLWGAYATGPFRQLGRAATLDVYYLGLRTRQRQFNRGVGRELRHTLGLRLNGQYTHLSYDVEGYYQFGNFAGSGIRAGSLKGDLGYTWLGAGRSVRLSLGGGLGSGDQASPTLSTLNPLFPTGYYFGPPAQPIGPSNICTLWPGLSLRGRFPLTLALSASLLWRQSLQDGVYSLDTALLFPAQASSARYLGTQLNLRATWQVQRHLTLALWAAYFNTGRFLQQATPGRNLSYVLPSIDFRF